MGKQETTVTATGKNRIMIYGPKLMARTSSNSKQQMARHWRSQYHGARRQC
jgi:hypothetical protein